MSDVPTTFARRHAKAESDFSPAKRAVATGWVDPGLMIINQTEIIAGRLPKQLQPLINLLLLTQQSTALKFNQNLVYPHSNGSLGHLSLAFIPLLRGQQLDGWREREYRWQHPGNRNLIPFVISIWSGSHQPGARLWVRCEQSYGDFPQFCRLLTQVAARGASVVVTVPPGFQRLAQSLSPKINFQPEETEPTADTWASHMSIPDRPHWIPPEEAPTLYRQVAPPLPSRSGHPKAPIRRSGWVSAGNLKRFNDRNRSLGPESLEQFRLPAALQAFEVQPNTRLSVSFSFALPHPEIKLNKFSETARSVDTLDLVTNVATWIAYLARSLGIPVLILLPYAPNWPRRTDSETKSCYCSARLIRQPRPNDGRTVPLSVKGSLVTLVA